MMTKHELTDTKAQCAVKLKQISNFAVLMNTQMIQALQGNSYASIFKEQLSLLPNINKTWLHVYLQ